MPDHVLESGDSPELEDLFDSIARQQATVSDVEENNAHAVVGMNVPSPEKALAMYAQIGQMTRKLHDALRELGYDKSLEKVADAIPDAKDRLSYIATLTANAAERVLNATDIAKPLQDEINAKSTELSARWGLAFSNKLTTAEFKLLAEETRVFLESAKSNTVATNAQLMEIVMAQDFQDLTGQVIKKVMEMVKTLESELLTVLIEYLPVERKGDIKTDLLQGPVVNPDGRSDVVTNQQQVDDLLESLGF